MSRPSNRKSTEPAVQPMVLGSEPHPSRRDRRGAPRGNQNARKHGIYVRGFLSPEEERLYCSLVELLRGDFPPGSEQNLGQLDTIARALLRLGRALSWEGRRDLPDADRRVRTLFRQLRASRAPQPLPAPADRRRPATHWLTKAFDRAMRAERKTRAGPVNAERPKKGT
jgi:hypothetical protein